MDKETFIEKQEEHIAIHIFTVSAALIGVCLTVIGILGVISATKKIRSFGDDLTAIDAIVFLVSCVLAYIAIKTRDRKRKLILERTADSFFLAGLSFMALVCFLIVYALN